MNDLEAIRRLKDGDIGGLETLMARYQRKAVQTAYLITHDEQMAEDVAQDVFVRVFQHIRHYDENRSFEPYLLRSVANLALNTCEKTARWVQFGTDADLEVINDLLLRAASTEEMAEYNRLKGEVATALKALPPRQRTAIVQRYYLGMSEQEMAESLSTAPGTVKWLLNNARQRLRSLLSAERSAK
jgi:RNA polymerase sigma-70 factor (ECF subfamily)